MFEQRLEGRERASPAGVWQAERLGMQRPLHDSIGTVFRDEQGGRSGKEVDVGHEIQILVGDQGQVMRGWRSTLRSLALTLKEINSHCRVLRKGVT